MITIYVPMKHLRASIRFTAFVIGSICLYTFWWVTSIFIPNKQYWRQLTLGLWSQGFVRISGMELEVIGEAPKPPFFLVANHLGYADIPALRAAATGIFVAKHDIGTWFLAGRMVRDMGNVFVNRANRRDIPRAGEEIIEKLSQGEGVIVFPEGTSTKGEDVLPFNSSFLEFAARTDLPVSYAAISYRTPPGEPTASEAVCWWDDTGFVAHMYRLFSLPSYTAVITFGEEPVVMPDRKQLAEKLREKVKERFIPVI